MPKFNSIIKNTVVAISLVLGSGSLFAFNESLSFTRTSSGTIAAVVSGMSDGPACQTEFVAPDSVVVNGNTITITSTYISHLCPIPFPSSPYSVAADLGNLNGSSYQVTWTEGPLVVSGTLIPDSITLVAVPTLSWPTLLLLIIGMLYVGTRQPWKRTS